MGIRKAIILQNRKIKREPQESDITRHFLYHPPNNEIRKCHLFYAYTFCYPTLFLLYQLKMTPSTSS